MNTQQLSLTRRSILAAIKQSGAATTAELATRLDMTDEGMRQHLNRLEHRGWIERRTEQYRGSKGGRPKLRYTLTATGEELFPKHYDLLAVEVLDTVMDKLGPQAIEQILSSLTESRVREWEPRLRGMNLTERLEVLKEIYSTGDPFISVESDEKGLLLIERNCPFFTIAMRRPALCSLTVSVLSRLLGVQVVRENRFQNGDGRCSFRVLDVPATEKIFTFETD